jgi:histidinol-phosphatase (PHP family)
MESSRYTVSPGIDYHVHSNLSVDAYDSVEAMCARAVDIGLTEIVFTEHYDTEPADEGYEFYDYEKSHQAVQRMQDKFSDRLTVKLGIEVDYQTVYEETIAGFLAGKHYDYVLGARHWEQGALIGRDYFEGRPEDEAYGRYFETVLPLVETGLFDVLAHIDLVKRDGTERYGTFEVEKWMPRIEPILRKLVEKGMGLEINTSGVRQPPGEPYPGLAVVKRYRELGGRILTVGSDSHRIEQLGVGLDTGIRLAGQAGFTELTLFNGRKPTVIPL